MAMSHGAGSFFARSCEPCGAGIPGVRIGLAEFGCLVYPAHTANAVTSSGFSHEMPHGTWKGGDGSKNKGF